MPEMRGPVPVPVFNSRKPYFSPVIQVSFYALPKKISTGTEHVAEVRFTHSLYGLVNCVSEQKLF
jgi:hypothetical protein